MFRHVDIVDESRVQIDSVKALGRTIDYLQPGLILDGQVDEQWSMGKLTEALYDKYKTNHKKF